MNYNKSNHIILSQVDTDTICWITACIADTVLRPLYEFANSRNLFGYQETLKHIGEWSKEFYSIYESKLKDWDTFENSEENIYNSISWDDFATSWVNDRFNKFKQEFERQKPDTNYYGNYSYPKVIIVINNNTVASVFSTVPIVYTKIDIEAGNEYFITTNESDCIAQELCSLFDSDGPVDISIVNKLKQEGF